MYRFLLFVIFVTMFNFVLDLDQNDDYSYATIFQV